MSAFWKIIDWISAVYAFVITWATVIILVLMGIFGGEFSVHIKINWHTMADLLHSIKNYFK